MVSSTCPANIIVAKSSKNGKPVFSVDWDKLIMVSVGFHSHLWIHKYHSASTFEIYKTLEVGSNDSGIVIWECP